MCGVHTPFVSEHLDCSTPKPQAGALCWGMRICTHIVMANAGQEQAFFEIGVTYGVIADSRSGQGIRGRVPTWPALRLLPLEGNDPDVAHPSVPQQGTRGLPRRSGSPAVGASAGGAAHC